MKGWAGKILRVNLTTGNISTEPTSKYQAYIGGAGLGYKVLFDEVPQGTHPYDEANKVVFGVGPLTGSGVPLSGRTNITSLLPSHPYYAVADGHMGGNFGPYLKFAGWDGIIIEGKSKTPVWLKIENDKVSIEDASHLWGKGTMNAFYELSKVMGKEASIAAIGQAGENMVNLSTVVCDQTHAGGGQGGVLGSKKLKAIGVRGTLPVSIADPAELMKLKKYLLEDVLGANNNHSVPQEPQGWNEYYNPSSRWRAKPGLYWGAANPPVETGICPPGNMNRVAYRTPKSVQDMGPTAEARTVKMGGCHSCPVRCHGNIYVPELEQYGFNPYASSTCNPWSHPQTFMLKGFAGDNNTTLPMVGKALGSRLAFDYGIWSNYSLFGYDLRYAYDSGTLKRVLPAEEYNSIPWDLMEKKDPAWLVDFYRRMALKEGEFSHLGDGSAWVAKRWNFGDDYYSGKYNVWNKMGYPKHHAQESFAQVGALINTFFNRDAQVHTHQHIWQCGLPWELIKEIGGEIFGSPDALDLPNNYTPMNQYKAKFAKWAIDRNLLHDSLTMCNYTAPFATSPSKSRNYRGDTAMEAKFFTAVTGIKKTEEEMNLDAERIATMHRALTVKNMNTVDMRNTHDAILDWVFEYPKDGKKAFETGTIKMDRDDMQLALTMFYKEYGWDEKTGAPTRACLERLGMKDVADELERLKLLPA